MTKRAINLYLDENVIDEIQRLAERQKTSASAIVNTILKGGLDSQREVVTALEGLTLDRLVELLTAEGRKMKKGK